MLTCGNYNEEFLCNLLSQVDDKIALVSNRDYKDKIYNLGINKDASNYTDLLEYSRILNRILKCNTCYEDVDLESTVSNIKSMLNNC